MTPEEATEAKKKFEFLTVKQLEDKKVEIIRKYGVVGNIPLNNDYWVILNVLRAKRQV